VFAFWCKLVLFLDPDKSEDPVAMRMFSSMQSRDESHWDSHPERKNRWHARSVVIDPAYQRMGVGKRLMKVILERAEKENVPVGLEASMEGEGLYRSIGFDLLGRFVEKSFLNFPAEYWGCGGVMMWMPPAWKERDGESVRI
jgi:GNAT superfamily N-acetyltransferase